MKPRYKHLFLEFLVCRFSTPKFLKRFLQKLISQYAGYKFFFMCLLEFSRIFADDLTTYQK